MTPPLVLIGSRRSSSRAPARRPRRGAGLGRRLGVRRCSLGAGHRVRVEEEDQRGVHKSARRGCTRGEAEIVGCCSQEPGARRRRAHRGGRAVRGGVVHDDELVAVAKLRSERTQRRRLCARRSRRSRSRPRGSSGLPPRAGLAGGGLGRERTRSGRAPCRRRPARRPARAGARAPRGARAAAPAPWTGRTAATRRARSAAAARARSRTRSGTARSAGRRCRSRSRDPSSSAAPDRQREQHERAEQPQQRVALEQPAPAHQLEDDHEQQDALPQRSRRSGCGSPLRSRCAAATGACVAGLDHRARARTRPTKIASSTLIM